MDNSEKSEKFWYHKFQEKEIKIEDLKTIIKPGSRIFLGTACSEPLIFSQELVKEKYRWFDCQIIHFLTVSPLKYFSEDHPTHFRHNALSIISSHEMRKAVNSGKSDFTPVKSSEIPLLLKKKVIEIDYAFLQLSPPDEYGYCSLGINVDINYTVSKVAKIIIAQINSHVPRTSGNSSIKFEDIDHFLKFDSPLMEHLQYYPTSEEEKKKFQKIGQFASRLIDDKCTLNVGIGKLPPLIWGYLKDKKNLAIYSELIAITDELLQLIKNNVITCAYNEYPHIMTTFLLGSIDHYKFLDRNPFFELRSIEFLNNIFNIAKNHKLISIYSAIAVDLLGNITNHLKNEFYSGIGGEQDFITGTSMAKEGRTIIILQSTAQNDSISKIKPIIHRSNIVSSDVHFVITEWGIARLGGKSIRERALQLIGIAHPKFRKDLLAQAKKMNLIYQDQLLPLTKDGNVVIYPEKYEWSYRLKSGEVIQFRPVKPTDEEIYKQFFYNLDQKDLILRFLAPKKIFPHEQTQKDINIDYQSNMVVIGMCDWDQCNHNQIIAIGSYNSEPDSTDRLAEVAVTITKDWQKKGLGNHLFNKLIEIAIENDISGFYAEIAAENQGMISIMNNLPYKAKYRYLDEETISMVMHFGKSLRSQ